MPAPAPDPADLVGQLQALRATVERLSATAFRRGKQVAAREDPAQTWHYIGAPGEPAFAADWRNETDPGWLRAAFSLEPSGWVNLQGRVEKPTAPGSTATTIFTLPADLRPPAAGLFFSVHEQPSPAPRSPTSSCTPTGPSSSTRSPTPPSRSAPPRWTACGSGSSETRSASVEQLLPLLVGGGGLIGLGGLVATLYLLRSQRDSNIAKAANDLLQGSATFAGDLQEELATARVEIHALTDRVVDLTSQVGLLKDEIQALRAERDQAIAERDRARAQIGGRRKEDS